MNYKELTAPQLVIQWKKLCNDNVVMGRDSHLFKEALLTLTPTQILWGVYQYKSEKTISIPQFLRHQEDWLEDPMLAEVELAREISHFTPPSYWIYRDLLDENSAYAYQHVLDARRKLVEWSSRILE